MSVGSNPGWTTTALLHPASAAAAAVLVRAALALGWGTFWKPRIFENEHMIRNWFAGRGYVYHFLGTDYHAYHSALSYELLYGAVYALSGDNRGVARLVQWPAGLPGGRCLDVGTCDGFWAFEMERRGAAEVTAVDVDDPDQLDWSWESRDNQDTTRAWRARRGRRFEIACRALGSRVNRIACSVYDLDPAVHGRFDVVFCGTLLVHLRDPVRALERIRGVCAGELVLVECVDALLDVIARRVPCARFVPAPEQWWRLNRAGLLRMLGVAGFDVLWASRRFHTPFGPSVTHHPSRRLRPLRVGRSAVARVLRAFPNAPILADAAGLALGTYDVAVRARPRAPVERAGQPVLAGQCDSSQPMPR